MDGNKMQEETPEKTTTPEIGFFTNLKNEGVKLCGAVLNLFLYKNNVENVTSEVSVSSEHTAKKRHSRSAATALRSSLKKFKKTRKKRCKTLKQMVNQRAQKLSSKKKISKQSRIISGALDSENQGCPENPTRKFDEVVEAPNQQLSKKKKRLRKRKNKKAGKSIRTKIKPGKQLSNKKKISKKDTSVEADCKSNTQIKNSQSIVQIQWSVIRGYTKKKTSNRSVCSRCGKLKKAIRKNIRKPGLKYNRKGKISKEALRQSQDLLKQFNELLLQSAATQA